MHVQDVGLGPGRGFSVNVPLREGMDDESYESLFMPIMTAAVDNFKPGAIVLQSGTLSLPGLDLGKR